MIESRPNAPVLGVLLILAAMALLSGMDALVKGLMVDGMAVVQMLALRSWLVVPVMAGWAVRRGGTAAVKTARPGLHLLRVALGTGAPLFFFSALKTLSLGDATTIFFGATFIMTALSVPLLKERVGPHRWVVVVAGFVGVVIAMRPSGAVISLGALYAFGASVSYSLFALATRKLGPEEGTVKQVLYFHGWLGIVSTAALPFVFRPYASGEVAVIAGVGGLVVVGHLCMTRAFHVAPVGLVAPFEYTALVWAVVFGYLAWGDVPGVHTVAGAALIVASGVYLAVREARAHRNARPLVPSPAPSVWEDGSGKED